MTRGPFPYVRRQTADALAKALGTALAHIERSELDRWDRDRIRKAEELLTRYENRRADTLGARNR